MNSNNNQPRPMQRPVRANPNVRRPVAPRGQSPQGNNNRRMPPQQQAAPRQQRPVSQPPQQPYNPRPRLTPEQKREMIRARNEARRKRFDRIIVILLLAFILAVVLIVARACRGNIVEREKYQIGETEKIVADVVESDPELLNPTDAAAVEFDPQIESEYAVMVKRSSGEIIASRRASERLYPASLTKVMSLIVAIENAESLDDTIVFTTDMISPFYEQGASLSGFASDEKVNLRDLLYAMILTSGADATEGVVRLVAGDEKSFVELMNKKAKELGLKDTHFVNAVGLHDDNHYSTCNDMAVILDHALKNDVAKEILCTYKYTTSATEQNPEGLSLTSDLQSRMEGGESEVARIHGGKTGYTKEGGYCLVSYAKAYSDGEEYIIVTCKAGSLYAPVFDHINACKIYLGGQNATAEESE